MTNKFLQFIEEKAIDNKYKKWYLAIVRGAMNRTYTIGVEKHHIVPVCFKRGWKAEKDNIVPLTYREHFVAHKLLYEMFDGVYKQKMLYALGFLYGKNSSARTKNSRFYDSLRQEYSIRNSMRSTKAKRRVSDALRGRTKESHLYIKESAEKKSRSMKDPNSRYQKVSLPKIKKWLKSLSSDERKAVLGRTKTTEQKIKLSQQRMGQTAENCERVQKMKETKIRQDSLLTPMERKKKYGHSLGKHWYHNDSLKESKTFLELNVPDGWELGRKTYEKFENQKNN